MCMCMQNYTKYIMFVKIPEGEDSISFARHNSLLKSEARKSKPNCYIISELMNSLILGYEIILGLRVLESSTNHQF